MSTSLLYHAYGISGVQYQSTKFEAGAITIHAIMVDPSQCKCGCTRTIFKGQKKRQFKMVPFGGKPCFLNVLLHRVACPQCGHKWWPRLPFMKGKFRMVRSMIAHVLDLLHFSTLLDVSRFLKISWNVVKRIHKEKLTALYKTIPLEDLEYITVDEFSIRKGHEYMTVFTDLRSGRIIHAVEGRTIEAVAPFFKKLAKHAPKLKAIAMDMSKSYYPAAQEFLPNVKGSKSQLLQRELMYFVNNRKRLCYKEVAALKMPIGSGAIESAVRRVINLRLKSPCIFGKEDTAEEMLLLRAYYKSGRWNLLKKMAYEGGLSYAA